MERIQHMLERIADIYSSKNPKTAIDIDLMLDYTRVLYADLLEWKKAPQPAGVAQEVNHTEIPPVITAETKIKDADSPNNTDNRSDSENAANEDQQVWEIQSGPQEPENAWEEKMKQEDEEKGAVIANEFPAYTSEKTEPVQPDKQTAMQFSKSNEKAGESFPDTPNSTADQKDEEVKILSENRSGISFEPPHPAEPEPEFIKETLEEDVPEIKAPVREIPVEQQEKTRPDYAQIFKAAQSANNVRDIRKCIGINDKYLFLNELFNNNKTGYEEALDKLNKMNHADALKWTKDTLAVDNKWFEDDETVKSFYDVLDKHFTSR